MIEGKLYEKRNRCCPTGFWLFPTKYVTLERKKKSKITVRCFFREKNVSRPFAGSLRFPFLIGAKFSEQPYDATRITRRRQEHDDFSGYDDFSQADYVPFLDSRLIVWVFFFACLQRMKTLWKIQTTWPTRCDETTKEVVHDRSANFRARTKSTKSHKAIVVLGDTYVPHVRHTTRSEAIWIGTYLRKSNFIF